jgi:chromosome segregation ATPase
MDDKDVRKIGDSVAETLIPKMVEIFATKEDFARLEERIERLEQNFDHIAQSLDRIAGRLDTLHQEYLVLKERDSRYERWFKEIADKVGITLTP